MILIDFVKALAQMRDPRFMQVILYGFVFSIAALLLGLLALYGVVACFIPESYELPYIGQVAHLQTLGFFALIAAAIPIFYWLMVPVAGLCSGFFLEQVADAVEDWHYPYVSRDQGASFWQALGEALRFTALLIAVNIVCVLLLPVLGPLMPFVYIGVNGALLGREYFMLVGMRHLPLPQLEQLRRRHRGQIFMAGVLLVLGLMVPFVNLIIPILGVASFTHLFHRLLKGASSLQDR